MNALETAAGGMWPSVATIAAHASAPQARFTSGALPLTGMKAPGVALAGINLQLRTPACTLQ